MGAKDKAWQAAAELEAKARARGSGERWPGRATRVVGRIENKARMRPKTKVFRGATTMLCTKDNPCYCRWELCCQSQGLRSLPSKPLSAILMATTLNECGCFGGRVQASRVEEKARFVESSLDDSRSF